MPERCKKPLQSSADRKSASVPKVLAAAKLGWSKAIKSSAAPERVRQFLLLLSDTAALPHLQKCSAEDARILATLFSGSQALSNVLVAHPDWLAELAPESLSFRRRKEGLRNEITPPVQDLLKARDYGGALRRVREFKQCEILRIGARDLARLAQVSEITRELSDLADTCLDAVWRICHNQLGERYGLPFHQDPSGKWQTTSSCVIGLGKLGGQELNYSSDVDVVFVYSEEGAVFKDPPKPNPRGQLQNRPSLTNHQFFNRLAETFIAEVSRMAPEGMLFRIDLRLRPEGDTGPLSRSLSSYENYYAQWGQTWERMMLLKARGVAGDQTLTAEFLETIQPFRYARSVTQGVLTEVAAMKDRIETEVLKGDEVERNVKLGRGGIREVEFVAQALQLLHAGRQPFLQGSQTLPALEKLAQYDLLSSSDARDLRDAYCFLRDVEHRLQMEGNLQTHTLPTSSEALERLSRLMGFKGLAEFEKAHQCHRANVRRIFEHILKTEEPAQAAFSMPAEFEGKDSDWKQILREHAFKDPDKAFRLLREFTEGPGYVHVSPRTKTLALGLLPRLFALCPSSARVSLSSDGDRAGLRGRKAKNERNHLSSAPDAPLSDPDRVVTRLDSFIAAYGARSTLFELWNSNPAIFELLIKLFDRSEFLAELAVRTPDLVDELVASGRLRQNKKADETLADLRHGLADQDQFVWLRRYHQAEFMRIGLRDILGLADFEQYLIELSALADACLRYALEVVMRKHRLKAPPFTIIGLGKLGGAEIDYGSDLDIIFVTDNKTENLSRLSQMAVGVMELLSKRTEQGLVFHTDARLRPDGEKGLLVNSLKAYEEYYRHRAQLWEIQSLTRTRVIAGNPKMGEQFQALAAKLTNFKTPVNTLAAYSPDWKEKIHHMRMRIEKERTPAGKDHLAIKTGGGGLMDAEFVAQTLCLENGWHEPNTMRALELGRESRRLTDPEMLIENYRSLRRVEGILRRWSYEGETVLPDDPEPFYRVSIRCGFDGAEAFRQELERWRKIIRQVYLRCLPSSHKSPNK
ncbi:MAG TPA: hypothetical protein VLT36_24370 [Candidatus Dormibacteraeota bacterium]|nr:hypothetical protein [Candidatus Dormibacteraeota bacterium]